LIVLERLAAVFPLLAKLKMNQRVPNKNANLLKKISLMGTEVSSQL